MRDLKHAKAQKGSYIFIAIESVINYYIGAS